MGLIKKAIVAGGLLVFLPSPPNETRQLVKDGDYSAASATYFSAARAAFSDVQGFCDRQPKACGTIQYVMEYAESKIRYNVGLAYEWATAERIKKSS